MRLSNVAESLSQNDDRITQNRTGRARYSSDVPVMESYQVEVDWVG